MVRAAFLISVGPVAMESGAGSSSSLPTPEAPQQPFRYLSLPVEVRKQIMKEAFIIGDVHVHPLPTQKRTPTTVASILDAPSRKTQSKARIFTPPLAKDNTHDAMGLVALKCTKGYPFPATCTQVYFEGQYLFLSKDMFCFPLGPASHAKTWVDDLQPKNQALVTTLKVYSSFRDITYEDWHRVYNNTVSYCSRRRSRKFDQGIFRIMVEDHMRAIQQKSTDQKTGLRAIMISNSVLGDFNFLTINWGI